uniref:Cadherin_C_2 domain-containing protein n=1 Tax=Macrostomum lignano TaxID=282301 RepID=A0A1I8FWQ6_9PLAT
ASLPQVSNLAIAGVAGCCTGLILALLLVLAYFCFRQRRLYKCMAQSGDPVTQLSSLMSPQTQRPLDNSDSRLLQQQQQQQLLSRPCAYVSPSLNGVDTASFSGIDDTPSDSSPLAGTAAVFVTMRSGHFPLGGYQ